MDRIKPTKAQLESGSVGVQFKILEALNVMGETLFFSARIYANDVLIAWYEHKSYEGAKQTIEVFRTILNHYKIPKSFSGGWLNKKYDLVRKQMEPAWNPKTDSDLLWRFV